MKKERFAIFILLSLFLYSCEKVVYIDLNSEAPRLIVQGNISDQEWNWDVALSNSINYYESNSFPPVSGASINIFDNVGNSETLVEYKPGHYWSARPSGSTRGVSGRTYNLKISSNGKEYTATSTMPYSVPIDSVNIEKNMNDRPGRPGGANFRVICKFKDPLGLGNYYKVLLTSSDTAITKQNGYGYRVLSDKLTDGDEMAMSFRLNLKIGDSLHATLECIDRATYDFCNQLRNVQGELNPFVSAPPANPPCNINNGALGYFAAYTVSSKLVVIK